MPVMNRNRSFEFGKFLLISLAKQIGYLKRKESFVELSFQNLFSPSDWADLYLNVTKPQLVGQQLVSEKEPIELRGLNRKSGHTGRHGQPDRMEVLLTRGTFRFETKNNKTAKG